MKKMNPVVHFEIPAEDRHPVLSKIDKNSNFERTLQL